MSASERLAALDASIHAVPAEDDEYAELVLEIESGSRPFSVAGAEAAKSLMAALPALVALVAAAENIKALDEIPSPITEDRAGLYRRAWSAHLAALAELDKVLS